MFCFQNLFYVIPISTLEIMSYKFTFIVMKLPSNHITFCDREKFNPQLCLCP